MSRAWLLLLLAVALTMGAAFALGLVGGEDPDADSGEALRGDTPRSDGPTGPMRTVDDTGGEGADGAASLTGRPGESPIAPRPPRLRSATVRVVDAAGLPVAGQVVSVFVGDRLHGHFTTVADGRIRLDDLPAADQVFVALGALDGKPTVVQPLTGETLELRASNVRPLRVDVVDAQTGALLPTARWVFTTPELRGGVEPIPSGEAKAIQVSAGIELERPFAAETPPDFVDWDPPWAAFVSRYATTLLARHPLRREASVTLQPIDAEKEDVRDAQVAAFAVGDQADASPQTGTWMLGGFALRGVPCFPGQTLRVWAKTPGGLAGLAEKKLPAQDHEELAFPLVLRKGLSIANEAWTALEPFRNRERSTELELRGGGPDALLGGLEVEVVRSDGRPAAGARLRLPLAGEQRTDEHGTWRSEEILVGSLSVGVDEPGLVPVGQEVEIVAGEVTRVVLREPVGATLDVTVKGEDGTPLPHAQILVGQSAGTPWADLGIDGVQRLDPYTDERGRRMLRRVQPGRIRLDGWWGGRKGTVIVNVDDRQVEEVTLILR